MPSRLDIPPVYFLTSAALTLFLHLGLSGPQLVHWPWRWLGLKPVVAGVSLASPVSGCSQGSWRAVVPTLR